MRKQLLCAGSACYPDGCVRDPYICPGPISPHAMSHAATAIAGCMGRQRSNREGSLADQRNRLPTAHRMLEADKPTAAFWSLKTSAASDASRRHMISRQYQLLTQTRISKEWCVDYRLSQTRTPGNKRVKLSNTLLSPFFLVLKKPQR